MLKSIPFFDFAQALFDSQDEARKAAVILKAMLEAQSPRLTDIAQKMPGKPDANYKQIQRFLAATDPKTILLRLFQTDAPFVLGDPTEIPRPRAWHTSYVGTLSDGKTKVLAPDFGHPHSRARSAISLCNLLIQDDWR